MSGDVMADFEKGNSVSQTAERTRYRQIRRQYERFHLRRERLNRVLMELGMLPEHYSSALDRYGKFPDGAEPKIAWIPGADGRYSFAFKHAFEEMVADLKSAHPEMGPVPYDWTLYYLRTKALRQPISAEELAWVLHSFNQKRGYNQQRGILDDGESKDKEQKLKKAKVVGIKETGEKVRGNREYEISFDDGVSFKIGLRNEPDFLGEEKEYLITWQLDGDGNPVCKKDGKTLDCKYGFPGSGDEVWLLPKLRTQNYIDTTKCTLGEYIYRNLKENPMQKIRGGLVRTVDRKYYRDELSRILDKQADYHPELRSADMLEKCLLALYPTNEAHRNTFKKRNATVAMKALLMEDVILYQRPLKSKKSLIQDCPYEYHSYMNEGKEERVYLKCASRSHPVFQEYRIWQFLSNLRIYQRAELASKDVDVTSHFLTEDVYCELFDWMNSREEVKQGDLLKKLGIKEKEYRWNYVEEKAYPCNKTRAEMLKRLRKAEIPEAFLTKERELALWHILYSVNNQNELERALKKFAVKNGLPSKDFCEQFKKVKPYPPEYAAYSLKALKRLVALMRRGRYWSEQGIDASTRQRIEKIIDGEFDETISNRVRELFAKDEFHVLSDFQGLPVNRACYAVYGRHSEADDVEKWHTPADIDRFIKAFRQHSLRNPIVEKVCLETLRVVRDVWTEVGHLDEIHVEMAREMRQTAKEREAHTKAQTSLEADNLRVRTLLTEFLNPEFNIENVRPYSPSQQELFKIYETTVLESEQLSDEIKAIVKKLSETDEAKRPSHSEVLRYKCWLEQKYRSPYTGEVIPLGKLFTPAYEIEHIIPRAVYFDNSFSNKVICEAEVNKLKSNQLAMPFIKEHAGQVVQCGGKPVRISTVEAYTQYVNEHYKGARQRKKRDFLLREDLPEGFINRQMSDTRYITRFMVSLLSNIVRQEHDGQIEQEATSRNLIVCAGKVTDIVKRDWGLHDVWNEIVAPRFMRLNRNEGSSRFGRERIKEGKRFFQPEVPLELRRGFELKRIDHRHHAMDAIVIACLTRQVIDYINNTRAQGIELNREQQRRAITYKSGHDWNFRKPWPTFTQEAFHVLQNIVVSFKQNLRVINKTRNRYLAYDAERGKVVPKLQTKGNTWAVRQPLHKETTYGLVNLRSVKEVKLKAALENPKRIVDKKLKQKVLYLLSLNTYDAARILKYFKENANAPEWKDYDFNKVEVYVFSEDPKQERMIAGRKDIASFDPKQIEAVTDSGIRRILKRHLEQCGGDPKQAFSPEGIEQMNANIQELNGGRLHQPIYKVRVSETLGTKFRLGQRGVRQKKFVEAAKDTNLFFAIYVDEAGKRSYQSLPLNCVVERQKQGLPTAPEQDEQGNRLLYVLSPRDLVYVPKDEELDRPLDISSIDKARIYKMVSCTKKQAFFIPYFVAKPIFPKVEFNSLGKVENTDDGSSIKSRCVPLKVDRLGNISFK